MHTVLDRQQSGARAKESPNKLTSIRPNPHTVTPQIVVMLGDVKGGGVSSIDH